MSPTDSNRNNGFFATRMIAVAFFACGVAFLAVQGDYPLMLADVPGPGFWPLALALTLIITSFIVLMQSIFRQSPEVRDESRFQRRFHLIMVLALLAAFPLSWSRFGFLATAVVFLILILRVLTGQFSWRAAFYSGALAISVYAVLRYGLRVPLDAV